MLSLDEQYIEFRDKTAPIFSRYQRIEPLRYFIFKELLICHRACGYEEVFKRWLHSLCNRKAKTEALRQKDVLIWVESTREAIVEQLVPLYRELSLRGVSVGLVSFQGPDNLPPSAVTFRFPNTGIIPRWAKDAWGEFCDVYRELRYPGAVRLFYSSCATLNGLYRQMDMVLQRVNPKIVLNASEHILGGAALVTASRLSGALNISLQHGILQPFYTPVLADYMLMWGEVSERILIDFGVDRNKLLVLGSPRHDKISPGDEKTAKRALLGALGIPERPTFVFFSNGNGLVRNGVTPLECAKWLESAAKEYGDGINIVVRLHPNEDGSIYKDCPHLYKTGAKLDLAAVLNGCDWIGSLCSTVLYEALLYKKEAWQFYADGWPELAYNWRHNLAVRISSEGDLKNRIRDMLKKGAQLAIGDNLVEKVFANHGQATQRIADFIQNKLNGN